MAPPENKSSAPEIREDPAERGRKLDAAANDPANAALLAQAKDAAGTELDEQRDIFGYVDAETALGYETVMILKARYGVNVTGDTITIDAGRHAWINGEPKSIGSLKLDEKTAGVEARFKGEESDTVDLVVYDKDGSATTIRVSRRANISMVGNPDTKPSAESQASEDNAERLLGKEHTDRLARRGMTVTGNTVTVDEKRSVWVDGKPSTEKKFTLGPDIAGILPAYWRDVMGFTTDLLVVKKDGSRLHIRTSTDPNISPTGNPAGAKD